MKIVRGLPFLAMGGATLGIVGAAALVPAVNAATDQEQHISVSVSSSLGVTADQNVNIGLGANAVNLDTSTNVNVVNNNAKGYTLTMTNASDNNALTSASTGSSISSTDGAPAAGNTKWAVSIDNGTTWKAAPTTKMPVTVGSNSSPDGGTHAVKFGVSTSATTTAADDYTATLSYNVTANQ